MINTSYLNHNFVIYDMYGDENEFKCIICGMRVIYDNYPYGYISKGKIFNEVDDSRYLTDSGILACEEQQIKNLLE
jgi:hypothetical protein